MYKNLAYKMKKTEIWETQIEKALHFPSDAGIHKTEYKVGTYKKNFHKEEHQQIQKLQYLSGC
jgi:hypothetical protein